MEHRPDLVAEEIERQPSVETTQNGDRHRPLRTGCRPGSDSNDLRTPRIPVVSDTAEGLGATYKGRHAGQGAGRRSSHSTGTRSSHVGGGMLASDDGALSHGRASLRNRRATRRRTTNTRRLASITG